MRLEGAAARVTEEQRLHSSQRMEPAGEGSAELSMEVAVNVELERWVLGWGEHAEVIEPPALRQKVAERLRQAAARYATTSEVRPGPSEVEPGPPGVRSSAFEAQRSALEAGERTQKARASTPEAEPSTPGLRAGTSKEEASTLEVEAPTLKVQRCTFFV